LWPAPISFIVAEKGEDRMETAGAPRYAAAATTIGLCFAVAMLEGFDIQAMGVAAPKLAPALHLKPDQMGWVFSISNVGLVIGAGFGGRLADRVGRKPVFIGAVGCFGLFTIATLLAGGFASLFAARFGAGLGFGAALPNMMAIAAEISRPDRRASTAVAMFCGMPLGGGLSALIAQSLPDGSDWRTLFEIGGALPLLIIPALMLFMREPQAHADRGHQGILSALFAQRRWGPTLLIWITFLPTLLILYFILNWLPTLALSKGLGRDAAPLTALAFNFASVAGALVLGRLVDRFGARWPLALAYGGLILTLMALADAQGLVPVVTLSGLAGFLLLGANYALYGVTASYYPGVVRGTGSGAAIAVGRLGSIAGPMLGGILLGGGSSAAGIILVMAPAAALAGLAAFALSFLKPAAE
jgi:MFS transporter, AAHS family, 3-hydroxyphenylpropionic acid transporter